MYNDNNNEQRNSVKTIRTKMAFIWRSIKNNLQLYTIKDKQNYTALLSAKIALFNF